MGLTACGDESVRRMGVCEPVYLLGAYIDDGDGDDLTTALRPFKRGG